MWALWAASPEFFYPLHILLRILNISSFRTKEPKVRMSVGGDALNYSVHCYFLIVEMPEKKVPEASQALSCTSQALTISGHSPRYFFLPFPHSTFRNSLHLQSCACLVPMSSAWPQLLWVGPVPKEASSMLTEVQAKHKQASLCVMLDQCPFPFAPPQLDPSDPGPFLPWTLGTAGRTHSRGHAPFLCGYGSLWMKITLSATSNCTPMTLL